MRAPPPRAGRTLGEHACAPLVFPRRQHNSGDADRRQQHHEAERDQPDLLVAPQVVKPARGALQARPVGAEGEGVGAHVACTPADVRAAVLRTQPRPCLLSRPRSVAAHLQQDLGAAAAAVPGRRPLVRQEAAAGGARQSARGAAAARLLHQLQRLAGLRARRGVWRGGAVGGPRARSRDRPRHTGRVTPAPQSPRARSTRVNGSPLPAREACDAAARGSAPLSGVPVPGPPCRRRLWPARRPCSHGVGYSPLRHRRWARAGARARGAGFWVRGRDCREFNG
jgi:hypothetical protein